MPARLLGPEPLCPFQSDAWQAFSLLSQSPGSQKMVASPIWGGGESYLGVPERGRHDPESADSELESGAQGPGLGLHVTAPDSAVARACPSLPHMLWADPQRPGSVLFCLMTYSGPQDPTRFKVLGSCLEAAPKGLWGWWVKTQLPRPQARGPQVCVLHRLPPLEAHGGPWLHNTQL